MQNKQNLHTHTTYADGKDTPEEMILEAMARGFDGLGFSEHTYMPFSSFPYQMKIEDMSRFKDEIRALKEKYRGKIDIFCGLEYEFHSDVPTDGFDYMIGSVHYLEFDGEKAGFDSNLEQVRHFLAQYCNDDAMVFAKKYFETVAMLPKRGNFDIIGHFDLLTKNNEQGRFLDVNDKQYLAFGYEAIAALKGKIPLFEVNTGAISRGYRTTPYPQMQFLKEFKRQGFGAVITSDCHDKNYLDCHFEESVALLKEAGFQTRYILTDDGFKEVDL